MEKIAQERGQETNIARGTAKCYIRLKTMPKCYFPYCTGIGSALTGLLYLLVFWLVYQLQGASEVQIEVMKDTTVVAIVTFQALACSICPSVSHWALALLHALSVAALALAYCLSICLSISPLPSALALAFDEGYSPLA